MRRSIAIAAVLASAICALPAAAQMGQAPVQVAPGNSVLTVNAEGRTLREPDLAIFNAGVTTQGQTAAEALSANARSMTQVIAALRRAGIAERDIQTSNLSVNPVYGDAMRDAMMTSRATGQPVAPVPPELQGPRIIGYQATNTVSVRQRNPRDFGPVIDTLAAAGANQINGPMFQLEDDEPALREARIDAVKQARERADIYAEAAGMRIVRILAITEGGGYAGPPPMAFARLATQDAASTPVQPGQVQTSATVSVSYELAPR